MTIQADRLIGVVGAGTMGAGIAQIAATAGHRVVVIDRDPGALQAGQSQVGEALDRLARRGAVDPAQAAAIDERISWTDALPALSGAALVIEAIIEDPAIKVQLFARIADLIAPDAVLTTNTSSLSIAELAQAVPRPDRFMGLHFFNPAPVMKLVEVVQGPMTDPAIIAQVTNLMTVWGKRPVAVADVPGFIVNHVARPYYAEGFAAWSEGIAPEAVDKALTSCGGFRMGPLALADLIGHDVNFAVATSIHAAYRGRTRFRPQLVQRSLVDRGHLGRKSGRGVYDVAVAPDPVFAAPAPPPRYIQVSASGGTSVELFREAGLVCINAPDLPHGIVEVDGMRLAMTDGRPLAARADVDALADIARDYAATNTIVVTARDEAAAAAVTGLVQATGRAALLVPDRPGMIVLRTLAQLANAAADAVGDRVASIEAIDEAMVYGANHPEGPLHWAERSGKERVASALRHIAAATGDDMYRPAPLLGPA